ncbi:hypothetical protein Adt_34491 [Abeliophyllum distichum]|uniref:Uncharacterized protein n=1 Tax=Abeliophyllum distichum TaxID=126358 RepID=A0ABD1QZA8_9LAMI
MECVGDALNLYPHSCAKLTKSRPPPKSLVVFCRTQPKSAQIHHRMQIHHHVGPSLLFLQLSHPTTTGKKGCAPSSGSRIAHETIMIKQETPNRVQQQAQEG